jgi:flagellar basal-body rod modification protein FlgD
MAIQNIGSSYNTTTPSTQSTKAAGGDLGKDAFLQILVSQLKYQDPMSPMKADEMLSQLSQLTQVEQLTNLTASMDAMKKAGDMTQWISTIGKKVDVPSNILSKGDELTIMPQNDYDQIVVTLKNINDGSTRDITIRKGDSLTYTHDGDDTVQVSLKALKEGKEVGCNAMVFKVVKGVISADTGPILVFNNDETYEASLVKVIKN